MCRPGYTWNDTLKRCLAMYGGSSKKEPLPEIDPVDKDGAPATPEVNGRGDVRVNANGVKQTGTAMGKGISVK